ncbi:hypothetical protein [Ruegeria marina]|uniref:Uncharacterized protein n=1 Tax=Ruegeria marina TaxID=639004 RepID=A0A1G7FWC1_9RHOB|nr:hypothetical protein [Ruegeria marina]SDE80188.1 hypothetical protein SAMN04488239_1448 [Ruegeria marina]
MVPRTNRFGRNLQHVLEKAPACYVRMFLASCRKPDEALLVPPEFSELDAEEAAREALTQFVLEQDRDVLGELDRLSDVSTYRTDLEV